jgi:hypothetical protein
VMYDNCKIDFMSIFQFYLCLLSSIYVSYAIKCAILKDTFFNIFS